MISAGKLLYKLYYQPMEVLHKTYKVGIRKTIQLNAGRRRMALASKDLKECFYPNKPFLNVYFLTGKRYWFQTAFCLYSLQQSSEENIHAFIIDDGSFDDKLEYHVKRQFPTTVTIIRTKEILQRLDEQLPVAGYPVLRQRRIEYPHLRKLTDVHILSGKGPKLVLDSDMLFFHKPTEILEWLSNPKGMLFMRDTEESYGYSRELMQRLTGAQSIPERLNVGVAGIASNQISWDHLEHWTKCLLEEEGSSYLQEQALSAMIATQSTYHLLEEKEYKVLPSINGSSIPEILHHYVADSKYDYFVKGWKFFIDK